MKDNYTKNEIMTKEEIKKICKEKGIEMIRLEYIDVLGINRGKLVPVTMLDEMIDSGIPFCATIFSIGYDNEVIASDCMAETCDDLVVVPDLSTFTLLPFEPTTALILADIHYLGQPFKVSPRCFLKKMVDQYHELGYEPVAASELEFYVYNKTSDGGLEPYTCQASNCYTVNDRTDPKKFLYKLTQTFNKMDFNVLYMNHEYYPGQYEYNWKHASAVRAADESALFKGIAKDIANREDMAVSFMAKPKGAAGGSGCHFHLSLNDIETGENICYDPNGQDEISDTLRYMIGGIIKHANALTAFLAPTVNCYKRYQPDSFAPIFVGWGHDNRTTYIRIPKERGKASRLEIRAGSAACNPYLALGAILAAGLDGIKNKIVPPEAVVTDLYHDEEAQSKLERVPRSLYGALNLLKEDTILTEAIGAELAEVFKNMKEHEVDEFNKYVTDWEDTTYSYHV